MPTHYSPTRSTQEARIRGAPNYVEAKTRTKNGCLTCRLRRKVSPFIRQIMKVDSQNNLGSSLIPRDVMKERIPGATAAIVFVFNVLAILQPDLHG
jgi:hypothetical protein